MKVLSNTSNLSLKTDGKGPPVELEIRTGSPHVLFCLYFHLLSLKVSDLANKCEIATALCQ